MDEMFHCTTASPLTVAVVPGRDGFANEAAPDTTCQTPMVPLGSVRTFPPREGVVVWHPISRDDCATVAVCTVTGVLTHPVAGSQESIVHGSSSSQPDPHKVGAPVGAPVGDEVGEEVGLTGITVGALLGDAVGDSV